MAFGEPSHDLRAQSMKAWAIGAFDKPTREYVPLEICFCASNLAFV